MCHQLAPPLVNSRESEKPPPSLVPLLSRYFFQGKFEVGGKFVPGYFQWKRAEAFQDSKQTCKSACSYCAFFLFSIARACALSSVGLADTHGLWLDLIRVKQDFLV